VAHRSRSAQGRVHFITTLVPNAFAWTLEQFKAGKLPAMLQRAGYPTVAAALDDSLIASKLPEVEAKVQEMLQAVG
jgi:hypothetical protein